jgi:hypothetical protein
MTEFDKKWNMKYEQLLEFKREKDHCMVPRNYEQDKSLGQWVQKQRSNHKNNKLRPDRKELLDEIGFAWKDEGAPTFKPDDKLWHNQYEKLVELKRKRGHCVVPRRKNEEDKSLGYWVMNQRSYYKDDKLRLHRKKLLDELGFVWKAATVRAPYSTISSIVGDLPSEAQEEPELLDELGLAWKVDRALTFKPNDKLWHQQYERLLEYKRENGHCKVSQTKNEQDKSLGNWVHKQRTLHNKNKLGIDRKRILDGIGFAWKPDRAHRALKPDGKLWHQQYEKLLEYKRKKGHCKVPTKYKDDKSLGMWVSNQRARHANNKMLLHRKELLDALEFVWKADTVATRSSTTDVRGLAI